MPEKKNDNNAKKDEKVTMSQHFFHACLLIFGGILVLWLAVQLLAQFWIWLAALAGIALVGWIAFRIIQARRNRW